MQINSFFSKTRIIAFLVIFTAVMVYIIASYAKLAFTQPDQVVITPEAPLRGSILDRNNKPLAIQTDFYHLKVTPSDVKDVQQLARVIAPVAHLSADYIVSAIENADINFLYLKKEIDETEMEMISSVIKANALSGINFDTVARRVYPENNLASQVIGFMGYEGKGLSGIELSQQEVLVPVNRENGKSIVGNNIFLTIDANLQYKLEQIADRSMEETKAESFMLVAASAKTGEILSYISLPSANLNTYPEAAAPEKVDRPAVLAYEPGSVFKIFSVASFIEKNAITQHETFFCNGVHTMTAANGETSEITCLGYHGNVTAREALQYSCNDALAQMSEKMSSETFLSMIRDFGFGEYTYLEVPSETRGSVKTTSDRFWSIRSKPTMSIGQELSVSALQMVQATTAIANGGIPLQLSFISQITDSNGKVLYQHTPKEKERVISKATADYVLSTMETTAQFGTGTRAALGDISIGVKTGTAQITDEETGAYSETDFVSNVAAIFPVDEPEIVLYIVITKAQGETLSGRIVAPVIAEAANTIIDHLGLARANAASLEHSGKITFQADRTPVIGSTVPDFTGMSKRTLMPLLSNEDIHYLLEGDGWVVGQNPPAGSPITQGMTITIHLE